MRYKTKAELSIFLITASLFIPVAYSILFIVDKYTSSGIFYALTSISLILLVSVIYDFSKTIFNKLSKRKFHE